MADVQKYFVQFDDAIGFERDNEKRTLSEKRERVLNRLSEGIDRQRKAKVKIPSYEHFNQGSYAMGLGVKPVNGDFDIDVGLRFALSKDEYPNPLVIKQWVYDAVKDETTKVKIRRGCVTVFYQQGGEDMYHVDLVCYSSNKNNDDKMDYIAKGKPGMKPEECCWQPSDPQALQKLILGKHTDNNDLQQFRRVIRALKRWKDLRFQNDGRTAPKGIALTVAAYSWFKVSKTEDASAKSIKYNDLEALRLLVDSMLGKFQHATSDKASDSPPRLRIELPISPKSDLCDNMSDTSMRNFHTQLKKLLDALKKAKDDVDPNVACTGLRVPFGDDFPVPEKSNAAQQRG